MHWGFFLKINFLACCSIDQIQNVHEDYLLTKDN